jgi:hypothetical protein
MYSSLQDRQVVNSSGETVSTATQTFWNIPDYNANSLKLAEASDKIRKLEDALYEKRKCVTKLRNKITRYNLRKTINTRAKENTLPDSKEKSNAQGQAETEVGLNDALITNDQIEADTGFSNQDTKRCVLHALPPDQMLNTEADLNNQQHPQLQDEQASVDSNCTAQANNTGNTGASAQVKPPEQKQTTKTTTPIPVPKDNTKACVIARDTCVRIIKTDATHKFIVKLLNNADDSSMECFCAHLQAAGIKFEESNDVSEYFSTVEDDLSRGIKQNLRELIQFRRDKCMQVKHSPKTAHKRKHRK